jgi:hypothetical protein
VPSKERLAVADQLSVARIPIAMPQVNLPPAPDGRPRDSPPVACTTVATRFAEAGSAGSSRLTLPRESRPATAYLSSRPLC